MQTIFRSTLATILLLLISGFALGEDDQAKKLPADAQALVDRAGMEEFKLKADFDAKVYKVRGELVAKLTKLQETVTKKGDLDGAMLLKAKIAELSKDLPEKEVKPVTVQDLKQRLVGTFDYALANGGHRGQIEVRGGAATDVLANIQGEVRIANDKLIIFWGNNTQWQVTDQNGALSAQASDGTSTLTPVGKRK